MTIKEFLEFISQDGNHFVGFLFVLSITTSFIVGLVNAILKPFTKKKKPAKNTTIITDEL